MQDRPDPMDIVALAAVELVTLRTRFQACLVELHASNGCRAPPTLTSLIRAASRSASMFIPPEPQSSSQQSHLGTTSSQVPRLNLDGAAASPLGPTASGVTADAAVAARDLASPLAGGTMDAHGAGHGISNRAEGGGGGGKSGLGMEQGQVEMMVEREREANAAIKQLKTEWRDERIQHDQQARTAWIRPVQVVVLAGPHKDAPLAQVWNGYSGEKAMHACMPTCRGTFT